MVFYRETKWPNVVLEIDFGFRFRTHFGARRTVWAFENVKTLPKQGPEKRTSFWKGLKLKEGALMGSSPPTDSANGAKLGENVCVL